jgi:uncharacterized protein
MLAKSILKITALAIVFGLTASAGLQAADSKKAHNIVIQVVDNDPARWSQTLNIAKNLKKDMGAENLAIEIVSHGGGINMIRNDSKVADLLAEVQKEGVILAACAATMRRNQLTGKDLYPGVLVVPIGAKELMEKQEAGWTYIRM